MIKKNKYANALGYLALFIWATSSSLAMILKTIPIFETLSISLVLSTLFTFLRHGYIQKTLLDFHGFFCCNKNNTSLKASDYLVGFLGTFITDFLFISAFKHAPALQVELISYLWPLMGMFVSIIFLKTAFKARQMIACLFGLFGVCCIFIPKESKLVIIIHSYYMCGYILAFLGALTWAIYCLFSTRLTWSIQDCIGRFSFIGACFFIVLHKLMEVYQSPTLIQWVALLILGLFNHNIAYLLWDKSLSEGNFEHLCIVSYLTPVIASIFLLFLGYADWSYSIIPSILLITYAGFLSDRAYKTKYSEDAL